MSSRAISVFIDDPKRIFRAGDRVRGTVQVEVEKQTKCNGLTIALGWRTHGRGNIARGDAAQVNAFVGDWTPGVYTYPFEFVLPGGPVTYRGQLLNVEWQVHATADVPWAFDPQGAQDLVLLASDQHVTPHPAEQMLATAIKSQLGMYLGVFLGMFFVVSSTLPCLVAAAEGVVGMALMGIFPLSIGLGIIFWNTRSVIAKRRTGEVVMEVTPVVVMPGEQVSCRIHFTPTQDITINAATVALYAEEVVVSGSGTDRVTHRNMLHNQPQAHAQGKTFRRGEQAEIVVMLTIPQGAPPSFAGKDNKLVWKVMAQLDIPGWPDWSDARELWVQPLGSKPPQRQLGGPAGQASGGAW